MELIGRPNRALLDQRRQQLGLSKREHAKQAGVSFPTLLDFEAGRRRTHPSNADRIARAVGATVAELYNKREEQ